VGGSVRDLLLGRHPKDFDIGTSAHPYQVKRLFRNCWIIGRRFRLAHVRFGPKTIEVATFRRLVSAAEQEAADAADDVLASVPDGVPLTREDHDRLVHRDNTFGTPEEDAFRRDFTINALFYDIGTFSIIDYTGGLEDLRAGLVRCIGNPSERFQEDPVRMLRAVAMAARLDFTIDKPIDERGFRTWCLGRWNDQLSQRDDGLVLPWRQYGWTPRCRARRDLRRVRVPYGTCSRTARLDPQWHRDEANGTCDELGQCTAAIQIGFRGCHV
jgi:hypothetical protein